MFEDDLNNFLTNCVIKVYKQNLLLLLASSLIYDDKFNQFLIVTDDLGSIEAFYCSMRMTKLDLELDF